MPKALTSMARKTHAIRPKFAKDDFGFYCESDFMRFLRLEQKRATRSERPILLMLMDVGKLLDGPRNLRVLSRIGSSLSDCLRETDVTGWYESHGVIGVIFTEILSPDEITKDRILRKIHGALYAAVGAEVITKVDISFHIFPENPGDRLDGKFDPTFYPDSMQRNNHKRFSKFMKRVLDLAGSSLLLVTLSPVLAAIALAIKFTSKGPVFFRQERAGLYGKRFIFLKFRSMFSGCDESNHKQYIEGFIAGHADLGQSRSGEEDSSVFKLTDDPRITPVGQFLRRTSLDELPQFINVLRGEMSLVGPRPPIPYELGLYDIWHRCRLVEVKPGVTGLWQVEGRSSTTFDNMVRLDLRYIEQWSLWLDIKILLKTPWVVLTCRGAY